MNNLNSCKNTEIDFSITLHFDILKIIIPNKNSTFESSYSE